MEGKMVEQVKVKIIEIVGIKIEEWQLQHIAFSVFKCHLCVFFLLVVKLHTDTSHTDYKMTSK